MNGDRQNFEKTLILAGSDEEVSETCETKSDPLFPAKHQIHSSIDLHAARTFARIWFSFGNDRLNQQSTLEKEKNLKDPICPEDFQFGLPTTVHSDIIDAPLSTISLIRINTKLFKSARESKEIFWGWARDFLCFSIQEK